MKYLSLFFSFLLVAQATFLWGKKGGNDNLQPSTQVLIIGLHDNVKSNYYVKDMIAEETGIQPDSIDKQYNHIIAQNIAEASSNDQCKFIPASHNYDGMIEKIEVTGEGEDCASSLSKISVEELQTALDQAQANYLLVLNQHYLKWQGQPMHTVFHMISYTLYDKNKKEVYSGNQYFTTMELEKPEKMKQVSKKSSSRIASSIIKSLKL